ncbi:MAG: superoxide dismutase [Sediminibacterium sp.]|nr:superoxide dismutase [Sediminibacterium sp.]
MAFTLPPLGLAYDALEPFFDARTMEIHYTKHHQAYVDNLNKAVAGSPAENYSLDTIVTNISAYSAAVRNNGGGDWNHTFFWQTLAAPGQQPSANFISKIESQFQSFDNFKSLFNQAGLTRFGSGWAWLLKQDNKLIISSTPNQDIPLMDISEVKGTPIIGLDVWEHAYYLKYQNKRADYLAAFWNVVNWSKVDERLG